MTPTTLALVERLANDASNGNGAMSANLPPLPEPHSTRKVWVDGIPSHLFTAEQMFAFRARGLAAQAAELEALRADAASAGWNRGWADALLCFARHGAAGWSTEKAALLSAAHAAFKE